LPTPAWSNAILVALYALTCLLWCVALRDRLHLRMIALVVFFLSTMLAVVVSPDLALFHEVWAGELIALSLAAGACRLRSLSLAAGGAAVSIRELAVPYIVVMAVIAWRDRRRREAAGWVAILGGFCLFFAWHASQVSRFVPEGAPANSWIRFGGWCFVLRTAAANPLFFVLPTWAAAFYIPFASWGLWRWSPRVAAVVTLYLGAFMIGGRTDNWYWGYVVAPLLPLGAVGWLPPRRA
jgi:hypothetical protein